MTSQTPWSRTLSSFLEKEIYVCMYIYLSISIWSNVLFKAFVFLVIFYLNVLSIEVIGVLNSHIFTA